MPWATGNDYANDDGLTAIAFFAAVLLAVGVVIWLVGPMGASFPNN